VTRKSSQIIAVIALLLVTAAVVKWQLATLPEKQEALRERAVAQVEVAAVRSQDLTPREAVVGRLQPKRRAQLRFEVAGAIAKRLVEPGAEVVAGTPLLQLAQGDYRDSVTEKRSQLALEKAGLARDQQLLELAVASRKLQQAEVGRQQRLGRESLTSRSRLDESSQRLQQLLADEARLQYSVATGEERIALAQASLNRAQRNLQRTHLNAPFAATVNSVAVEQGDYVSPTQVAVELIDATALDLYAELVGTIAAVVELGDEMGVSVAGKHYRGRLVALQIDPDPKTHTHPIRIRITADSLLPGMLAQAELALPSITAATVVPITALLREEGETHLFIVEQGVLVRRTIETGIRIGELQQVLHGVAVGERVVVSSVAALTDGQSVASTEVDY